MKIKINKKTNEIIIKCKCREEMIQVIERMKKGFEDEVKKIYGEVEVM